ncbi:MAG: polysaccharide lyase [Bacteroidota bacterium]
MKKITSVIGFLLISNFTIAQTGPVLHIDFEDMPIGVYTDSILNKNWNGVKWSSTKERSEIVTSFDPERGKVLQVYFPKGAVGPEQGGIQFVKNLPPANEYYLDYYIKFERGFSFSIGGKLPGLTSGGAKYSGGVHPDEGEGWSARYMWVKNKPIIYLYYVDMQLKYGETVPLMGEIEPGKWYRFTQYIRLNDPGKKNGYIQVWIDGVKSGYKKKFRLRLEDKGLIDSFYFSTFHGGASEDWAPVRGSYIRFDDFKVTTEKPDF